MGIGTLIYMYGGRLRFSERRYALIVASDEWQGVLLHSFSQLQYLPKNNLSSNLKHKSRELLKIANVNKRQFKPYLIPREEF